LEREPNSLQYAVLYTFISADSTLHLQGMGRIAEFGNSSSQRLISENLSIVSGVPELKDLELVVGGPEVTTVTIDGAAVQFDDRVFIPSRFSTLTDCFSRHRASERQLEFLPFE
jgi:hypothetical protein